MPLHKVLDVILSQLNELNLGYEFSDNVLTISTNELLPKNAAPRAMENVVRVYNVRDLVEKSGGGDAQHASNAPGAWRIVQQMGVRGILENAHGNCQRVIAGAHRVDGGSARRAAERGAVWTIRMQDFHGLITVTATEGVQDRRLWRCWRSLRKADIREGTGKMMKGDEIPMTMMSGGFDRLWDWVYAAGAHNDAPTAAQRRASGILFIWRELGVGGTTRWPRT